MEEAKVLTPQHVLKFAEEAKVLTPPHVLKFVEEDKVLTPPHVLKFVVGVNKDMLPAKKHMVQEIL